MVYKSESSIMNTSDILQDRLIELLRGNTPPTPVSLQIALSAGDPLMDGSGLVEPPGPDGYARQVLTLKAGVFTLGVGTLTSNDAPVVFGPAVNNDWPQVSHAAILDQAGNQLAQGLLAAPRTVTVGDTYSLAIDSIQLLVR